MVTIEGDYSAPIGRFGVVVARFNETVTRACWGAASMRSPRLGVPGDRVDVAWVPGSFEIPLVARKLAETGRYAAVICLGCVIRGETSHYDHVAGQAAAGVLQASLATGVPLIFGILTTETVEQALNRSGLKGRQQGGRGRDGGDRDGQPARQDRRDRHLTDEPRSGQPAGPINIRARPAKIDPSEASDPPSRVPERATCT